MLTNHLGGIVEKVNSQTSNTRDPKYTLKCQKTRVQDHRPVLRKPVYRRLREEPPTRHGYAILLDKLTGTSMPQVLKNAGAAAFTETKRARGVMCRVLDLNGRIEIGI